MRWPGAARPPGLDRIAIPTAATAPEWLDADATDELMGLLREMERLGTVPEWMQLLLARHRAGTLVDSDGCLELMDGLAPEAVVSGLLAAAGKAVMHARHGDAASRWWRRHRPIRHIAAYSRSWAGEVGHGRPPPGPGAKRRRDTRVLAAGGDQRNAPL
ncbi:MAG: hypothetical protein U5L11_01120 [Arhodomonas sp.]|nr:hypothetical protein [Arhodomonas sp.]